MYKRSYMFQSIWTIFRELMLVLTKVTLLTILPLKYSVKILSVSWFRLCVYPVMCGVIQQQKFLYAFMACERKKIYT
jgi:hypothetical protein